MSPDRATHSRSQSSAFTLIELLVVIGIIGILIALVITVIPKVKRAVYGAETQAQLSTLSNAIQQYYSDFKAYPGPLSNNQLGSGFDGDPPTKAFPNVGNVQLIGGTAPVGFPATSSAAGVIDLQLGTITNSGITGSENLVLGLLGGLRVVPNTTATGYTFEYHPEDIFPDGINPAPHGAQSLNIANPRKSQAYLQVKSGDLSVPNNTINNGQFTDSAGRYGFDSMIPEFLDKYAEPLPILYYRTNAGAQAICGYRVQNKSGAHLADPNNNFITAQYDVYQNAGYIGSDVNNVYSTIGTVGNTVSAPTANPTSIHGLRGLGTITDFSDVIDTRINGQMVPSNNGSNAIAYFKDPSANPPYDPMAASPKPCNTYLGVARQKDGFLLISAGPDRLYGTSDDSIFPGSVVIPQ